MTRPWQRFINGSVAMVLNLLLWGYMSLLGWVYGMVLFQVLRRNEGSLPPCPIVILVGVIALSTLTSYLSLLLPIDGFAQLLVAGLGLLGGGRYYRLLLDQGKKTLTALRQTSKFTVGITIGIIALLSFQSAVGPFNYDTGLYHAQSVQWMEKYPVVMGLGNLHSRLAFNSAHFSTCALFGFRFWLGQPLHAVNGYLLGLGVIYAMGGIAPHEGPLSLGRLTRCLTLLPLIALIYDPFRKQVEASSFSTDLPGAVLVLLAIALCCQWLDAPREQSSAPLTITIVAVFAVAVKLSTLPILILPSYFLLRYFYQRQWIQGLVLVGGGALILAPFFLRNLLLSGYLVYPLPTLDLFNFDWQVPVPTAAAEKVSIESWAKIPLAPSEQVAQLKLSQWFPLWWKQNQFRPELWVVAIGGLLFMLTLFLRPQAIKTLLRTYGWIYLTVLGGILFWFQSAPDIRFGYGFLIAGAILLAAPFLLQCAASLPAPNSISRLLTLSYLWMALLLSIVNFKFFPEDTAFLIQPMVFPPPPGVAAADLGGQGGARIFIPRATDQCWDHPIPCTPRLVNGLSLRGPDWRQGFRVTAAP